MIGEIDWREYFYYDETSPTFLRWRVQRYGGLPHNRILVRDTGSVAGWINIHGYPEVKLDGVSYKCHRIIYEMFLGKIPEGMDIDHEDGVRNNNQLSNLRICDDKINSQNRKIRTDNTSGVTGVNRYRNYWMCRWTDIGGKERSKSFNINTLGEDTAFELACIHRTDVLVKLINDGQFYTERHGK